MTVVEGFALLLKNVPEAKLYIIYQSEETPGALEAALDDDETLKHAVHLVGKVNNEELANWYLAADFFVAGSRREACGYALLEAMSCGCIPVVTDIPSFRKITADATVGFLYEPGNPQAFMQAMNRGLETDRGEMKKKVMNHFRDKLSFEAIAKQIVEACNGLVSRKGAKG
jgi:glycosyltransferase involved in cell wall biosynthesis